MPSLVTTHGMNKVKILIEKVNKTCSWESRPSITEPLLYEADTYQLTDALDKNSFAFHGTRNFLTLSWQPTQTQNNPVQILLLNFLKTHFNIILRLGKSSGLTFPSACLNARLYMYHITYTCYTFHSASLRIQHTLHYKSCGKYKLTVTVNKVLKNFLLGLISPCNGQVAVEEGTTRYGGLLETYIENNVAN
jgi:hypothetical protein